MKIKYFGILGLLLILFVVPVSFASEDIGNITEISEGNVEVDSNSNPSYFLDNNQNIEEPLIDDGFVNTKISYTQKNTFYVNSSYEGADELGTIDHPYKNVEDAFSALTLNRSIVNIYIANGEYEVSKTININKNLNIVGENPLKTIISGKNSTEIFFTFKTGLNLNIVNLTFTQGNKYYGGAIYGNRSNVKLINTIFNDNYATEYNSTDAKYSPAGGALYNEAGTFRIYNSTFINNKAKSSLNAYGGAIYNDMGTLSIINSKFINNSLSNCSYGSGGAIYNYNGFLTLLNTTFADNVIDSNYSIGGAIYNYEAHNVYVINSTFDGNEIYGEYTFGSAIANSGSLFEVVNSTVVNNIAYGIGIENSTIYNINGIYNFINSEMYNNTIKNPKENILMCLEGQFIVSKAFDDDLVENLPSKYDLRNEGLVTYAKNQGSSGACWTFSIMAALESYLLKYENVTYDLSENNMKNIMGYKGVNGTDWVDGGNYQMALAYLLRWSGPVDENDDSFSAYSVIPNYELTPLKHVQGAMFLPMRLGYLDNNQIKYAIMKYGALYVSLYGISMTKSQYSAVPNLPDHAIAIVGWDDNYPANRFTGTKPAGNGAFIIKNSWGSSYGERGFGYVSYYDKTFAGFSLDSLSALAFTDVENITNYKDIYQYDNLGNTYESLGYSSNVAWMANQFTAASDNPLSAIGFYTYGASDYLADIYVNGDLKYSQEGKVGYAGYHTVKLNELVSLAKGDLFRINLKLNTYDSKFPIALESVRNGYSSKAVADLNQSFVSPDGINWFDIVQEVEIPKISGCFFNKTLEKANVCLKAYTANVGDLKLNISTNITSFFKGDEILATFNLINLGDYVKNINVTLNLDKIVNITSVNATEGIFVNNNWIIDSLCHSHSAILNLTFKMLENKDFVDNIAIVHCFDNLKNSNVTVKFNLTYSGVTRFIVENVTVFSKSNRTVNVTLLNALSKPVSNEEVLVYINNENVSLKTDENGLIQLNLDLLEGNYIVSVIFKGNDIYCQSNATFNVDVIKRGSKLVNMNNKAEFYSSDNLTFLLTDENGNGLSDRPIIFAVHDYSFNSTSNDEGIATFNALKTGNYMLTALFEGDDLYDGSKVLFNVSILKKDVTLTSNNINTNAVVVGVDGKVGPYLSVVLKSDNVSLINKEIKVNLASKTYTIVTDENGIARLQVNIAKAGTYTGQITFLGDDEFNGAAIKNKVVINKKKMSLKVPKKTYKSSKKIKTLTATLKDNKGKVISSKKISFKVNGKTYTAKTNKKGVASVKVKIAKKKSYTVTVSFKGDSSYYKITKKAKLIIK